MRAARTAAVLLAASLLVGCGGDTEPQAEPDPEPTSSRDTRDVPSERDLLPALLTARDVPATHGTAFERFTLDTDAIPTGDDVTSGPQECRDYLDGELEVEPVHEVEASFGDRTSTVTVTSTAASFARDDAEELLAVVRDLVEACDRFTLELQGREVEVDAYLSDLADMPGYEDVGDEGLLVGLLVIVDGVPFRGTATTMVRVGELVGTVAVEVPADFGRDPSPELVALLDERLRDLDQETAG